MPGHSNNVCKGNGPTFRPAILILENCEWPWVCNYRYTEHCRAVYESTSARPYSPGQAKRGNPAVASCKEALPILQKFEMYAILIFIGIVWYVYIYIYICLILLLHQLIIFIITCNKKDNWKNKRKKEGKKEKRKRRKKKGQIKQKKNKWNAELDSKSILIYFRIQKGKRTERQRKGNKGIRNSN